MVENVLITEAGGDPSAGYESKPTLDLVELMNAVDATVPSAVGDRIVRDRESPSTRSPSACAPVAGSSTSAPARPGA